MYGSIGQLGPFGQMVIFSIISIMFGRWFGMLGILCFLAGWYGIAYYPSVIRTIVFWVMCLGAGISLLGITLFLGSHTSVAVNLIIFGLLSLKFWLWNVTQEKKYLWEYQQRREIISKWEDFILYDAAVIWWICLTCIGFLEKGGSFVMEGKVITMDSFLQFFMFW